MFAFLLMLSSESSAYMERMPLSLMTSRMSSSGLSSAPLTTRFFKRLPNAASLDLLPALRGSASRSKIASYHGKFGLRRVIFQNLHGLGAYAPFGHVDDARDRLAVEGIVDDAKVRQKVLISFRS